MDGDGKQDLALRTLQGIRVFKNVNQSTNNFIEIEARDRNGQTVEGSLITIVAGDRKWVGRLSRDGSFNSQRPARLSFGLGRASGPVSCRVRWPNGVVRTFEQLSVDQRYRIQPGLRKATRVERPRWSSPLTRLGANNISVADKAKTPKGKPQALLKKGRVTIVNLWAPWCEPCKQEMPHLNELAQSEAAWLDIVGLGVEEDKAQQYENAFRQNGLVYTLLMADKPLLETIFPDGQSRLPTTLVFNRTGQMVRRYAGVLTKSQLEAIVRPLENAPTNAEDYVWKAEMAEQQGDLFAAYLALKKAVTKAPNSVPILVQAAYSADRSGAHKDAIEFIERAVVSRPKNIIGWRAIARLLTKYKGVEVAQARVEKAPNTVATLILKSELAGSIKDEVLALKLARDAEKMEPNSREVKRRIRWLTDPEARKLDLRNIGDSESFFE